MFCETVLNKLEDKSTLNDTALAYALELFWKYPSRLYHNPVCSFLFPQVPTVTVLPEPTDNPPTVIVELEIFFILKKACPDVLNDELPQSLIANILIIATTDDDALSPKSLHIMRIQL